MFDENEKQHADAFGQPGAAYLHGEMKDGRCQFMMTGGPHEFATMVATMMYFKAKECGIDPRDFALEVMNNVRMTLDKNPQFAQETVRRSSAPQDDDNPFEDGTVRPFPNAATQSSSEEDVMEDENGMPYINPNDENDGSIPDNPNVPNEDTATIEEFLKHMLNQNPDDNDPPLIGF